MTSSNYISENGNSTQESSSKGFKRKSSVNMGHKGLTEKKQGDVEASKRSKTGNKLSGQGIKMATNSQIPRQIQDALTTNQYQSTQPMPNAKGTYHKASRKENGTKLKDKTSHKDHQPFRNVVHASGTPVSPATQHFQNETGRQFDAYLSQLAANQPPFPHMPSQFEANQTQRPNHTQYQQFGANLPQWPHVQSQFGANQPQLPIPMPFPIIAQGTQEKGLPVNDGRPPQIIKPKDQERKLAKDKYGSNAQHVPLPPTFQFPHHATNTNHTVPNTSQYDANQPNWSYPAQFPAMTPHSSHSAPFPSQSGPPGMQIMGNGITINIESFKNVFQFWDRRTAVEPAKNECKSSK